MQRHFAVTHSRANAKVPKRDINAPFQVGQLKGLLGFGTRPKRLQRRFEAVWGLDNREFDGNATLGVAYNPSPQAANHYRRA